MSTPRHGKYCPRCRTMTFVDREVCDNCGHQFRTGRDAAVAVAVPTREPDALHRTMQFTLPPLASRPVPAEPPPAAPGRARPAAFGELRRPGRRGTGGLTLAALIGLTALGVAVRLRPRPLLSPVVAAPLGVWETGLTGRSESRARLGFVFGPGGEGTFSWREEGAGATLAPQSGQSPLRWRLDSAGRLTLAIQPPPDADPVAGTLAGIFNSHPWTWRVAGGELLLGSLTFQRR